MLSWLQICDGCSDEERRLWSLKPAKEFHYLNQSSCYTLPRVDNAEEYKVRAASMATLHGQNNISKGACFGTKNAPENASACGQNTRRAMTLVGIPEVEQNAVFATVAAVLHLGNITFSASGEDAAEVAGPSAGLHLDAAARLLGSDSATLQKALTTRTRQTPDGMLPAP